MRRSMKEKEKYPDTHKSFAILPFKCEKCKSVIYLEQRFWAITGPYCGNNGHIHEVCCKCFIKLKDANDFFFNKKYKHPTKLDV